MFDFFVGWLGGPVDRLVLFTGVFGTVSGYLVWRRTDTPKNDTDRTALVAALREDRFWASYDALLARALDALDARLSVHERANDAPPRATETAWSFGLLNLSLTLALAYPIGSLLVNWGLFNNGTLGGGVVIVEEGLLPRVTAMCGLSLVVVLWLLASFSNDPAKRVLRPISLAVAAGFSTAIANAFAGVVAGSAAAVAAAGVGAVVGGPVAGGAAVAISIAFAVVIAASGAVTVAVSSGIAVVAAVMGVGAIALAAIWIGARLNLRTSALTLWALLGLVVVSLAARNGAAAVDPKGIILFIGVLPLINGLADFASTGLTRHLLRRSLVTSGRWEALLDLIGGAVIFAALGCAIIAFIHMMPLADGSHLANLPQVFAELGDPALRGGYWWLLVMLASTLLPTVLHLHLGLATLIRHVPARLRHWLADEFELAAKTDSNTRGRDAVFALSALNAAAVVVPLWAMTELWISVSPYAIDASIAGFGAFAQTIGAIP